jgi:S-adenosylmethionine:tRNA ribosyltransferase-isomerase
MVRASHRGRLRPGQVLLFGPDLNAEIIALPEPGVAEVRFCASGDALPKVLERGEVPLPPYIHRPAAEADRDSYQTRFARQTGAVACPTAGLHFTDEVLQDLGRRGIETVTITLHVGPGTFMPVRQQDYTRHRMLPEYFEMSAAAAARLNQTKGRGQRIVAVGSTSTRVLEYCASPQGFQAAQGWCDLFIYPDYQFSAVDRLLTNFHLPKSTLLLLVSALFRFRGTALLGLLLNSFLAFLGIIMMADYSLSATLAGQVKIMPGAYLFGWLLLTTFPDIMIALADFLMGLALYRAILAEK